MVTHTNPSVLQLGNHGDVRRCDPKPCRNYRRSLHTGYFRSQLRCRCPILPFPFLSEKRVGVESVAPLGNVPSSQLLRRCLGLRHNSYQTRHCAMEVAVYHRYVYTSSSVRKGLKELSLTIKCVEGAPTIL